MTGRPAAMAGIGVAVIAGSLALTVARQSPVAAASPIVSMAATNPPNTTAGTVGYWLVGRDGGIFPFGTANTQPQSGGQRLNQPIVGMAGTCCRSTSRGYWLVGASGGVFAFGDLKTYPQVGGGAPPGNNIVGMAPTNTDHGYWLVASDGGIFPFGDAVDHGNALGLSSQPIVGMASTSTSDGYWLVASDGGIFPFGATASSSNCSNTARLNRPIVMMARTSANQGCWLVASDGGIFPFGDATMSPRTGCSNSVRLNSPIVGMAVTGTDSGCWLVASDGGIFPFGDALQAAPDPGTFTKGPQPPPGGFGLELPNFVVPDSGGVTQQVQDGSGTVTVNVPNGALPVGTRIAVYRGDTTALSAQLPSGWTARDAYAFSWTVTGGSRPTASLSINVTVSDPTSDPADVVYRCTQASGRWSVSFTDDPAFDLGFVSPESTVPEFPLAALAPLFASAGLVLLVVRRRRRGVSGSS
jgi:hypothetical protein